MLAIALHGKEESPASLEKVAKQTGKSKRYLEQIALALKRASLLRAVSGRRGGYYLARPADQITLGDVVEATIGPISIVDCVLYPEECTSADDCEFRLMYILMNQCFTETLNCYTLADLTDKKILADIAEKLVHDIAAQDKKRTERAAHGGPGFSPVSVKRPTVKVPEKLRAR